MFDASVLDTSKQIPEISLKESARVVRERYRIGLGKQFAQRLSLRFSSGQITGQEYYYYRLYDQDVRDGAHRFLGYRSQVALNALCTHPHWRAIVNDKFLFSCLFEKLGFPVPKNVAVYHPTREFGPLKTLRNQSELRDFLQNFRHYPLFSKPVGGMWSTGTAKLLDFDIALDEIKFADGRRVSAESYMSQLAQFNDGYLFQEVLHPHDAIFALCGDRVASIRLIVVGESSTYWAIRALWKIPVGRNMADNFWRAGNLLAALDIETGRVMRAVRGVGEAQESVETHPDTGKTITGFEIPHWKEAKNLCLAAAAVLPHIKIQAWDISVCREGPVLQEVNSGGDYNLPQLAHRSGLLDEKFCQFLDAAVPSWRRELRKSMIRGLLPKKLAGTLRQLAR